MNSALNWILAVIFGLSIGVYAHSKYTEKNIEKIVKPALEMVYILGQEDAISGDVRIHIINDSLIVWTKSPWDDEPKACIGDTINIGRFK